MNIGHRIFELRKEKKLSQEKLAEKVGVTRQTISNWELNESSPDLKQAKELSMIFNISIDELVNNDIQNILLEKTAKSNNFMIRLNRIMLGILISLVILVLLIIFLGEGVRKSIDNKSNKSYNVVVFCELGENNVFLKTSNDSYKKLKELYEKQGGKCYKNN